MKFWKSNFVVVGLCVLLGSCFVVSAEDDTTGDVYYTSNAGTAGSWTQNNNRDNVDITAVSATVNGDKITLSLTVLGTIQTTEKFMYYIYYNTSTTNYVVIASSGNAIAYATLNTGGEGSYGQGNATIAGSTITAVFDVLGGTESPHLMGIAVESVDEIHHVWWEDWAPNTGFTGVVDDDDGTGSTQGDDDDNDKGIPGFEAVTIIAAIGVALILLRRKK